MGGPVRVLAVESEPLVQLGLQAALQGVADLELCGFATDGAQALDLAREHRPDLVILDVQMPPDDGFEVIRQLLRTIAETRVLVLTRDCERASVRRALAVGARGYVTKDCDPALLPTILRLVARGELYLSQTVANLVVGGVQPEGETPPRKPLSRQEKIILQYIGAGATSKEIATRLGISVRTVDSHRASLMKKLDIHTVAGLTRHAISLGLVQPTRKST